MCRDRRSGESSFLHYTQVLQEVLLPRLSTVDLFRLSCTSNAMQRWLLNTPVALWQVKSTAVHADVCLMSAQACPVADLR